MSGNNHERLSSITTHSQEVMISKSFDNPFREGVSTFGFACEGLVSFYDKITLLELRGTAARRADSPHAMLASHRTYFAHEALAFVYAVNHRVFLVGLPVPRSASFQVAGPHDFRMGGFELQTPAIHELRRRGALASRRLR